MPCVEVRRLPLSSRPSLVTREYQNAALRAIFVAISEECSTGET
jgi:hypothetical protein